MLHPQQKSRDQLQQRSAPQMHKISSLAPFKSLFSRLSNGTKLDILAVCGAKSWLVRNRENQQKNENETGKRQKISEQIWLEAHVPIKNPRLSTMGSAFFSAAEHGELRICKSPVSKSLFFAQNTDAFWNPTQNWNPKQ